MNQFKGISQEARSLLGSQYFGVLSTISDKVGGYPFGSVVPDSNSKFDDGPAMPVSRNAEGITQCSLTGLRSVKPSNAQSRQTAS